jgi:hypothetical protein
VSYLYFNESLNGGIGGTQTKYKNITVHHKHSRNHTTTFYANLTDLAHNVPYSTPSLIRSTVTIHNVSETGLSVSDRMTSPASSISLHSSTSGTTVTYLVNYTGSATLSFNVSSVDDSIDDSDSIFEVRV